MDDARALPDVEWQGFAVMRHRPAPLSGDCGVLSATETGWQIELNGRGAREWDELARQLLLAPDESAAAYTLTNGDGEGCVFRAAAFLDDAFIGALLVAPRPLEIARDWLVARLGTVLGSGERFRLLDGRPSGSMIPRYSLVCYCHQIGDNEIKDAIQSGCRSVDTIGIATRAGTNCGSCQPRIADLLAREDAST